MFKVFVDSSVLVAASGSKTGASALVLGYCRDGKIRGLVTTYSVNEAQKNVFQKMGIVSQKRLKQYLLKANLEYLPPPPDNLVKKHLSATVNKDAPILAAATHAQVDILISLDQKHILTPKVKDFMDPIKIISPGELVRLLNLP